MDAGKRKVFMAGNALHFDHDSSAPLPTKAAAEVWDAASKFGVVHTEEI